MEIDSTPKVTHMLDFVDKVLKAAIITIVSYV